VSGGNQIEQAVRDELAKLGATIIGDVSDPGQRLAVAQMAADLAMIPTRMARGEDVTSLLAALKAEGLNRDLALRTRAETAAQQAWINVIGRLLAGVLTAAVGSGA